MPVGWEFIKLSQIGLLCNGYTPKDEDLDTVGTVPYFKISDMNREGNDTYLNYTDLFVINPKRIFPKNSIVFPKNGGAVFTNKKRILAQDSLVDLNTAVFIPSSLLDMRYVYTIFSTIDFNDFYKGTALPTIKSNFVNTKFYGLPPIAEQKRIIYRIAELFEQIDIIEQNQTDIDKLYEEFKKRTLTLAIQGKLVPQDPNDEPASVLLERIRAEKKAKLGKKYVESYIYKGDDNCYYEKVGETVTNISDEIPFVLPENWMWIRLGYVIDFSKSYTATASQISLSSWVLDLEDIEKGSGRLLKKKTMSETQSKSDKHSFCKGNVLYSKLRPYLNKVIIADDDGYCTTEILVFDFGQHIAAQYAQIYLMSPYFVDYAMAGAYGVKMPRIGSIRGNAALMPVPPFNEQIRIVQWYNTICEQLKDEG